MKPQPAPCQAHNPLTPSLSLREFARHLGVAEITVRQGRDHNGVPYLDNATLTHGRYQFSPDYAAISGVAVNTARDVIDFLRSPSPHSTLHVQSVRAVVEALNGRMVAW